MNALRLFTALLMFFLLSVASKSSAHDLDGKSISNSAPAGIGGNGPWTSKNITMLGRLSLADMGSGGADDVLGNDLWGWTDSTTGKEYALLGMTNATAFVDMSDATNPLYLGQLPTETGNVSWRDVKVYNDRAYIVSDNNGAHGMQIFDLAKLRTADSNNPATFSNDGLYTGIDEAHNIAINESTGYAYLVGAVKDGTRVAAGGLHVLDLNNAAGPVHVGDFAADDYTHDVQVVNYLGPDSQHSGKEIAFASNEDSLTIVDVSDKTNMMQLSRNTYLDSEYSHQGWLSEDQQFFFMNDELDELRSNPQINTRTRVWDVSDLDNPLDLGFFEGEMATIDHNLYVKDEFIYQANYTSGLRILRIRDAANLDLQEYANFDSYNTDDGVTFNGAWSVFPYFDSGTIILSDRQNGLFFLKMNTVPEPGAAFFIGFLTAVVGFRRRRV